MLRSLVSRSRTLVKAGALIARQNPIAVTSVRAYSVADDYLASNKELLKMIQEGTSDGYELREFLTEMQGDDYVPGSEEVSNLMRACRKLNDYGLAIRVLEAVKFKCGTDTVLWNNLQAAIQPTLTELGIASLEQMGYDKPELYYPEPDDVHNYDSKGRSLD
ncbi:COX5A-like protein [Mya arenaria]|uniref:Cytochrome c oxidase subunit 5A, mitochondrial n=1 Tax=Mya arenaria TaxID=6604 RepID=A0ABY7DT39_MYAAR|nr:cytochrome c oxidase subunit 5A, mitochondrial-like [Mya arenaria]WAQ99771.1 COX5A-like protein [Mya arenaria]